MAGRTLLVLILTVFGFVAALIVTHQTYYLPLMFWVVAAVYVLMTSPRRWL